MPYIKQEDRPKFEESINAIVDALMKLDKDSAKGQLNYTFSSIIARYIKKSGIRYHLVNDFIGGVLTCVQLELYRRIAAPYEDKAAEKNGDIEDFMI